MFNGQHLPRLAPTVLRWQLHFLRAKELTNDLIPDFVLIYVLAGSIIALEPAS